MSIRKTSSLRFITFLFAIAVISSVMLTGSFGTSLQSSAYAQEVKQAAKGTDAAVAAQINDAAREPADPSASQRPAPKSDNGAWPKATATIESPLAALTGLKTVCASGCDYTTLGLAIDDLNLNGVGLGGVTFSVTAGNAQTAPVGGYIIGGSNTGPSAGASLVLTTSSAANPIVFTGNGNVVTASSAQTSGSLVDGVFKLVGADYVTIQTFAIQESGTNLTIAAGTNNMTEWGIALLYVNATDGSQNNTIQSNTISLNRTYQNSFGIYSNVRHTLTSATVTADITNVTGSNFGNKVYTNAISNVNYGIVFVGCGSTTVGLQDNGNDIGGNAAGTGNTITNSGGIGVAPSGFVSVTGNNYLIFSINQYNDNISFNNITSATGTETGIIVLGGILKNYSTTQPTGTITTTINNNTVTLTNNPAAAATGATIGINNQGLTPLLSTATVSLNNNVVQNSTVGGSNATTGGITGITNVSVPGTLNMTGNTVSGNTINATTATTAGISAMSNSGAATTVNITGNSIINNSLASATATSAIINGIANSGAGGTVNINNNIIRGHASTAASGQPQGITNSGAVVTALNINNNQFGNASGGFFSTSTATSGTLFGISTSGGASTCALSITGNDIRGITYNVAASASQTYLQNSASTLSQNISSNTFTNLNVNTTGSVTFISNGVNAGAAGFKTINGNSIVTAFNKGGAGGTVTLYSDGGSSVSTPTSHQNNNNNFSNITVTGATIIAGWNNTDGTGSTPAKTITGNTFSNWTGGTSSITALNSSFGNTNTVSNNTITNITGQSSIVGLSIGSSGTVTTLNMATNTITGLSSTGAGGAVTGLSNAYPGTANITSNVINTLSSTSITATVVGITTSGTTPNISLNTINTLLNVGTTSGVTNGIMVTGGTTVNLFKNKIYDLSTTGAFTTTPGVNGIVLSAGTTVSVYNNIIGLLTAPAANSTDAIRGISVSSTTTSSTYNVYYNTVRIPATSTGANFGTTGIFHAASATSTTAALNLRNNAIVNVATPNGTGLVVAYRRSAGTAGTLANYASTSNNNDFYAGTPGASNLIYSDGTSSAQTMAAYKGGVFTAGTIASRDSGSFSENPTFLSTVGSNANFLHIDPTVATQLESGAAAISGITDDFDGDTRNASTPDVGADEFVGIGLDLSPPVINYTNISNSSCLTAPTLSATITDASGVNATAGGKPRLYYKRSTTNNAFVGNTSADNGWKYVVATNASSPFSFTPDYSIMFGGAPTTLDVIQYFVVAADLAGTPNVGINAGSFVGATPTTVDLQAQGVTSIGGTPSSYTLVTAGLFGTVTIGATGTYPSLTGATGLFADINTKGLSGALTVNIIDASVGETGATALNAINYNGCAAGPYAVLIKPGTGVATTLTGSLVSGLITLNAADSVTVDGSNNGTTSRDLTITNTNVGTSSAVVWLQNNGADGATGNTIKNVNIVGSGNTQTLIGIGSGSSTISTSSLGTNNNSNTIQNNNISKTQFGIYTQGLATGTKNTGNTITQNLINTVAPNNVSKGGIITGFETNLTISQNNVSEIAQAGSPDVFGISLGIQGISTTTFTGNEVTNATVSRNVIGNIRNTGTFSACGICIAPAASGTNVISNNMLSGVSANGTSGDFTVGILAAGGTGSTTQIYFNSVSMTGTQTGGSDKSYGLAIASGDPIVDVRNNIFYNTQNNGSGNNFAIVAASTTYANMSSNYNDFFVAADATHFVGATGSMSAPTTRLALSDWITATGKDTPNSVSGDPKFLSATDLHISTVLTTPVANAGTPIGTVLNDIDNDTRSLTTPDIGADEGAFVAPLNNDMQATAFIAPANGSAVLTGSTVTPQASFTNNGINLQTNVPVRYRICTDVNCTSEVYNQTGTIASIATGVTTTVTFPISAALTPAGTYTLRAKAELVGDQVTTNDEIAGTLVVANPLGGAYSVGSGGNFTSLTNPGGVFDTINGLGATSNVVVNVTSDLTSETGAIALNQIASGVSVFIQPSGAARTISGSNTTALINLNGADGVSFSGLAFGGHSLTIRNTSATTGAVFQLANDASGNLITSCNIEGGNTSTSSALILIGTGTTTGNDNNTVTGSTVRDRTDVAGVPANLIASLNASTTAKNTGNSITNNILTNFTSNGFATSSGATSDNWTITGNDLSQTATRASAIFGFNTGGMSGTNNISSNLIHGFNASGANASLGFLIGNSINLTISKNRIYDFQATAGATGVIEGIEFDGASGGTPNVTITNNFISLAPTLTTAQAIIGIQDYGFSGNVFTADNNTVYIGGTASGATPSWAIKRGDIAPTTFTMRNNIAFNNRTGGTSSHFAGGDDSAGTGTFVSNNNLFAGTGTTAANFMDYGSSSTGTAVSFAAWQTGPPTRDAASIAGTAASYTLANVFVNAAANDLHIVYASPAKNTGQTLGSVLTDIDGNSRPQDGAYDIGADEYVDGNNPTVTILTGPSGPTNIAAPTFTFSGADTIAPENVAGYQCQVDAGGFASCTSPFTTATLTDGPHTFFVFATDNSGNVSTTASRAFIVDTVKPVTTINSGQPTNPTNTTSGTFGFSATDANGIAGYTCVLDGGAPVACNGGTFAFSVVGDGPHTFTVFATDNAGNIETPGVSYTWVLDTTAPDTTITTGPSGPTNNATPTFTFTSTEAGSTFMCRVDAAAYALCTTPFTTATLAAGAHTFDVYAIDPAGNADLTPASRSFTVDTTAPDTTITTGPSGPTNNATPTFTFTSTEAGGTFMCRVDAAAYALCTTPFTTATLAAGAHTFDVYAIDPAGNADLTPASRSFTVDTAAPDTTITSGPSGPTNNATPTFTFTSTEAGSTFMCRVDAAAYALCTTPFTTATLAAGAHTFDVYAIDPAGNADLTPASRSFTVDTTAPDTTITTGPSGPTNNATPTFTFTSTEAGSTFMCRVDAAAYALCTTPFTTATLADGAHTFDVYAIDPAGNADLTPASRSFTVDTTAPDTTIGSGPTNPTSSTSATFTFSGTDALNALLAVGSFECSLDAAPFTTCVSGITYNSLATGSHNFQVRAVDQGGNRDASPASFTWTITAVCLAQSITYVDDDWVGTALDADPDGAGPAQKFGCDAFATITGGVNGVSSGGQVIVYAGTYPESDNAINLTKSVTITGPNAAISPNTGSRVSEAVVTSQGTSMSPNNVFRLDAGSPLTVTIEGLKFDGTAAAINAYAPNHTISLKKNIFTASHDPGMYFETPNLTIDDNRFVNITSTLTEDVIAVGTNSGINRSPVTIINNVWTNIASGALSLDKISGTISGNQFINVQYYGMLIVHDSGNLDITDNLFDTITNPDPVNVPTWGAGVRFYEPAVTSSLNIKRNTFKNSNVGVGVRGVPNDPGADITGQPIHVNFNRIVGNTAGVSSGAAGILDAENNWWGCNGGPGVGGGAGCTGTPNGVAITGSGSVDSNPWLVLKASASPPTIGVGGTSTITANMTTNSAPATPVGGPVANMPVTLWSATFGTMSPTSGTISAGTANSTFTSTSPIDGTGCATVDGQQTCANITVVLPPVVQFSATSYREDESQVASITLTRSGDTSGTSSVQFATVAGGNATGGACPGADYANTTQTVSFGPGITQMAATVTICTGDTLAEVPDETVNLQLSAPSNTTIGTQSTAVLNINDTASQYLQAVPHTPIDITFGSTANPYPSQITVTGAPNIIGAMRVTLYDVYHALPDNIDVLLVGPNGRKYVLMGDVGGPVGITQAGAVTLTFSDDVATLALPDSGPLTTGQWLPTSCETVVTPFPGVTGPYVEPGCTNSRPPANTLRGNGSGFGLTNPNGTWSLYVRDDAGQSIASPEDAVGSIMGGWGLEFLAPTAAGVSISGRVMTADGRGISNTRVTVTGNSLMTPLRVTTGARGFYTIPDLQAGETYIVTINSRRFMFSAPSRVVNLVDNVTDADFVADPLQ